MKDQNTMHTMNRNENENTAADHCPMCPNHCPAGSPKCGRGERYFAEGGQGEASEHDGSGTGDWHGHGHGHESGEHHEHGTGGRHGHRDGEGDGRHHDAHEEHGKSYDQMYEKRNDLYGLMRQCGHHLYHAGMKSAGQGRILEILQSSGEMSQRDLQEMLQIKSGSISEIIGKMEAKGMLARTRDNEDQRCVMLAITEEGLERYRAQKSDAEKERENVFRALSQEEQSQLKTLLEKLTKSWEENADNA